MTERLQKVIARSGIASRRKAEELILSGKVKVNGITVREMGIKVSPQDEITVNGQVLKEEEKVYYLLNKPAKTICSLQDEKGRDTVMRCFQGVQERIFPVGRLDYDTTGLLIMTNDGAFADALMHPRGEVEKCYRTSVSGTGLPTAAETLRKPMLIDGYRTHGAKVELEQLTDKGGVLLITIREGRNRQVRKMCEQVGLRVTRLQRISEGGVRLGSLKSGTWRPLTRAEIKRLGHTVEKDET